MIFLFVKLRQREADTDKGEKNLKIGNLLLGFSFLYFGPFCWKKMFKKKERKKPLSTKFDSFIKTFFQIF